MRAGQVVVLVDADGGRSLAVVAAVVGAGASNYKTLDLRHGDAEFKDVPHFNDRAEHAPFWGLSDEAIPDTAPAAESSVEPVVKEKAPTTEPYNPVPASTRRQRGFDRQ